MDGEMEITARRRRDAAILRLFVISKILLLFGGMYVGGLYSNEPVAEGRLSTELNITTAPEAVGDLAVRRDIILSYDLGDILCG